MIANIYNILIVDDSKEDADLVIREIKKQGMGVVWSRVSTEPALINALVHENWDVVICDYFMPSLSCARALTLVKNAHPDLPFVILSGVVHEDAVLPMMAQGAADFVGKDRMYRLPWVISREARQTAERLRHRLLIEQSFSATIMAWGSALELRDYNTRGHTERVSSFALELAKALGADAELLGTVYYGSLLHDVGKIGIPDKILLKPGPLTADEWDVMKTHPELAYNMLKDIPFLKDAINVPWCHHERYDGTGYPRGLEGEAIPVCARIFTIADVYDALTSDRPYRTALSNDEAIHAMEEQKSHFDPVMFKVFKGLRSDE